MSFFTELKRRNVFRVAVAYVITAWLLLQVADVFINNIGAPAWLFQAIVFLLALGFPIVMIFSWVFEITPEGIRREKDIERTDSIVTQTARKLDRAIIIVLVMAVAYFIWESRFSERPEPTPAQTAADVGERISIAEQPVEPSIAVLPFTDMSPDKDQEYFSDGIAEELLNLLVRVDGLKVASRTSSFAYKGENPNIAEIASELKVDHVLEGSVRKAQNRVRITAQLIDAATDRHLWSDTYDRELEDIFGIQDEIANAIVDALRAELGIESEGKAVTVETATENLDAYELFLEARSLFVARLELPRAVSLFEQAVALDPGFARAWAGLAANYSVMESWSFFDRDWDALALEAADKALALDPELSTPWAVKGQLALNRGDPVPGVANLQKAIELDPENATHRLWLGIQLSSLGYQRQSLESLERCLEIDPVYENCRRHLALTHMILGDDQRMLELFQQGAEAGFGGSNGQIMQRFMSLGNRMMATQLIYTGENSVSSLPAKAVLDAMEFPNRDHSRGLARFQAWIEKSGQSEGDWAVVYSIFGAYHLVKSHPFNNRWIWLDENRGFRQSPYFKPFIRELGFDTYWREKGFPEGCRPLGEEDFECE